MSRRIGRRKFITTSSLAVAGAALGGSAFAQMRGGGGMGGGGGGMGGGGMGGGTTIVDPPVSGPLLALPVARGEPMSDPMLGSFTQYSIRARVASVAVAGMSASSLVYEDALSPFHGRFVAPAIRVSRGERVRLKFENRLPKKSATNILGHPRYPTNVHVHGLHVSPGADAKSCLPADDVHKVVNPGGGTLTFDYDLSKQRNGSLALYHPHLHGSVAEQMWNGLVGAIDVSDKTVASTFPTDLLTLKDVTISNGAPAPYTMMSDYMHGKEGQLLTVNGQVNPYVEAEAGTVRRLRILNVSNARFYRVALQGHSLHVIGTDGGLLGAPSAAQSEILMAPGERVDVLVQVSTSNGDYKLLALPYARMGNMATPQTTLMTIRVRAGGTTTQELPATIDGEAAQRLVDDTALPRERFALSMGMGRGYINGVSFEVLADGSISATEHHSMVGDDEIWEVVNDSGMDHPWHQHVNDAQLLTLSGGDAAVAKYAALYTSVAAWKDTIIIPKWGSATFRIPVRDFGGMTMFHCHILEHEDIGMMGMWHLMPMSEGGCAMPM